MSGTVLDPRTKRELMELLAARAREYAPMWRYEPMGIDPPGSSDPGAAIAEVFGELFYQSVDRFNQVPRKTYTEFLNLLGVPSPTVLPASGYVQFGVTSEGEPVAVPKDTEVFAPAEDGDNIVFATERKIEATAANLTEIYYADAGNGRIERLDLTRNQLFFAPTGGENLQFHRFALSQNEALALAGPCKIEVTLHQSTRFIEESTARRLADPQFASWKYWNGEAFVPFEAVTAQSGTLVLEKDNEDRLEPDEDGRICIYCDMEHGGEGDISLRGVSLSSSIPLAVQADSLANNDVPILPDEGGYCFSRRPAEYELFYIRSDDIFIKRGADVNVRLDISVIVSSDLNLEPQYEFNKRIIDKNDAVKVVPEDVFVQQVVWEYYNGSGWAKLSVSGNVNPFSGKSGGDLTLLFTVPPDMAPALVNAEEGFYIRSRVVNVENYLSTVPKWILPFIKGVSCAYRYTKSVPVDYICAYNNARKTEIDSAAIIADLAMTVFEPMEPHPRAMYLRFNASAHAMPLSVLFDILGEKVLGSKIVYEAWTSGRFVRLRAMDKTENLRYTGPVFLYVPEPLEEAEFFGQSGYWLRMSLSSSEQHGDERAPCVGGIELNTVSAVQRQRAAQQLFDTGSYDAGKKIELIEKPVLECEVWVDESSALGAAEMERLEKERPSSTRIEREGSEVVHCWVKWERIGSIGRAELEARVYELDPFAGTIEFGKGASGKVPPGGDLNIRVSYSYGGGVLGNLPARSVNALVGSISRVSSVRNITPMCGGEDRPPMPKIERLGNKRLRHRYVAMSTVDFEELALENFSRAAQVKCFPNTDEKGDYAPGHVCLVVMSSQAGGERTVVELCREIYAFLSERCDCNLLAGGRLHVVPSMEMTVNVEARVQMADLDLAAVTQQKLSDAIAELIDNVWRRRDIGNQIDLNELYQAVKATENVLTITRILPEGSYQKEGRRYLAALDEKGELPFATVKSGAHTIRVG